MDTQAASGPRSEGLPEFPPPPVARFIDPSVCPPVNLAGTQLLHFTGARVHLTVKANKRSQSEMRECRGVTRALSTWYLNNTLLPGKRKLLPWCPRLGDRFQMRTQGPFDGHVGRPQQTTPTSPEGRCSALWLVLCEPGHSQRSARIMDICNNNEDDHLLDV